VPADTLSFTARFAIEHLGVKNQELPIDEEAKFYPFQYAADDLTNLSGFLALQYPEGRWRCQRLGSRASCRNAAPSIPRDVLSNINQFIRTDFSYAARDAMGTQSPAQTLALRSGTCRDFALLMMEAARGLGIAARFVSGYIYDPALDEENFDSSTVLGQGIQSLDAGGGTVGSGATHAWLHVYLPGAGWVPFDPTNTLSGGTDLIRVAFTPHPRAGGAVAGGVDGRCQ
jgi:hypothetical protein